MSSLNTFAVPDPSVSLADESASIVSTTTLDAVPPTSPVRVHQAMEMMAATADRSPDRAVQQHHTARAGSGSRPAQAASADRDDSLRGQPLPPSPSPPAPSNLSAYARLMLEHTKQQLDATSAAPPPPHIRVAGPIGHGQYQARQRLANGTSLNGVPVTQI